MVGHSGDIVSLSVISGTKGTYHFQNLCKEFVITHTSTAVPFWSTYQSGQLHYASGNELCHGSSIVSSFYLLADKVAVEICLLQPVNYSYIVHQQPRHLPSVFTFVIPPILLCLCVASICSLILN